MDTTKRLQPKKENGVTMSMMLITLFSAALAMLLTLPNIYLDNQIYYESREIAHYQNIAKTLREEQEIIKNKLETIKYQDSIKYQDTE